MQNKYLLNQLSEDGSVIKSKEMKSIKERNIKVIKCRISPG